MKWIHYFIVVPMVIILTATASFSQDQTTAQVQEGKLLSSPSSPVVCGLFLRYLDDALKRAQNEKSTIFIVVRSRGANVRLLRSRVSNLKGYLSFRRFTEFEVLTDLYATGEIVELFVGGRSIYSLPITPGEKLEFTNC